MCRECHRVGVTWEGAARWFWGQKASIWGWGRCTHACLLGLARMLPPVSPVLLDEASSSRSKQLLGLFIWVLLALQLGAKCRNLRWSRLSVCETGVPAPPERREG